MKQFLISVVLVFTTIAAHAANVESSFDGATGTIVLPNLVIGDQVYYVELNLLDANSLTFQVNLQTALEITPTEQSQTSVQSDLYGTWTIEEVGGTDNLRLTFNSDGSYTHFENIGAGTEEACVGDETGSYVWEPSTGVTSFSQATDTNGECGMSDPAGSFLFFVDGNTLTLKETGAPGEETILTRAN